MAWNYSGIKRMCCDKKKKNGCIYDILAFLQKMKYWTWNSY